MNAVRSDFRSQSKGMTMRRSMIVAIAAGTIAATPVMAKHNLLSATTAVSASRIIQVQAPAQSAPASPFAAPGLPPTAAAPLPMTPGMNSGTGAMPGAGLVNRNTGVAGAAGNSNQAVATTAANAPQPAKGANSFTAAEARGRMEREGYTQVADLKKGSDGIWHGHGMKNGASVGVWLDYKGNVGQQ